MANQLQKLVIFGAGGYGRVVQDLIIKSDRFKCIGFLDDDPAATMPDLECLGSIEALQDFSQLNAEGLVVAVGDVLVRERVVGAAREAGIPLPILIHESASIGRGTVLDNGTVVMPGAVIGPDCRIGSGCIINTHAGVDHDCEIGDYAHIAPGAQLGGRVSVGAGTFIGMGAAVRDGVVVGDRTTIGMGAAVTRDIPPGVTAYGVPAKIVEKN